MLEANDNFLGVVFFSSVSFEFVTTTIKNFYELMKFQRVLEKNDNFPKNLLVLTLVFKYNLEWGLS